MRSEGDSWDIVSSVGRTALGVATFRTLETEGPDPLISDEYARLFVEATGDPHFLAIMADPSTIGDRAFFARMIGPRTRFFDEFFLAAAGRGVRQAVIVAAGLDARAYRLDWPAGTTVFEIDQPTVLEFKDTVLAEHHARVRAQRRTVAVDLRHDWPAALVRAGFDPERATAWSAEGLLPYLPGAAQDALFARIVELSAAGSEIAADGGPSSAEIARFRDMAQRSPQEDLFGAPAPFDLWYDEPHADPIEWLAERGWTVRGLTAIELLTSYGRPEPSPSEIPPELLEFRDRVAFWSALSPAAERP